MKKSGFLSILLITALWISLFPTASIAENAYSTMTGVVSLPGNAVAPAGGVKVTLKISSDNLTTANKNDDVLLNQALTIAQGQNKISYSIMVPKSKNLNARHTVSYTVQNGYAPFGWYAKNGTTAIQENLTPVNLNAGNAGAVDIVLLPGKTISGKIIMGNRLTALSKDMEYTVTAIQEGTLPNSNFDDIIVSGKVTVSAGDMEAPWSLLVPLNTAGKGYKVYYRYQDGDYKEAGYYHVSETKRSAGEVTLIDVSNTVSGIHLTTLPFTTISGSVYLPDGIKAPDNGIDGVVTAKNPGASSEKTDDYQIQKSIKITKDKNYANYSISVPVKSTGYIVSYTLSPKAGYIHEGFYNSNETVKTQDKATPIGTGNQAITGIHLLVLKAGRVTPTPTPAITPIPESDKKYDLNGDGEIDIFDLLELSKVITKQYEADKNSNKYKKYNMDTDDFKTIQEAFKPFYNNRYKMKLFNGFNWFYFDYQQKDNDCTDIKFNFNKPKKK